MHNTSYFHATPILLFRAGSGLLVLRSRLRHDVRFHSAELFEKSPKSRIGSQFIKVRIGLQSDETRRRVRAELLLQQLNCTVRIAQLRVNAAEPNWRDGTGAFNLLDEL